MPKVHVGDRVLVQDTRYYRMTEPVEVTVESMYDSGANEFIIDAESVRAVKAVAASESDNPDFFTDEDIIEIVARSETVEAIRELAGAEPFRHPASQMFHDVLKEMGEMHDRKQADYGSDTDPFANVRGSTEFGLEPWVGAMVRANDKMRRLQAAARGQNLVNESIEDSLIDLAVYAAIGLVLFRQGLEEIGHGD